MLNLVPYQIRAIHQWVTDSNCTPYLHLYYTKESGIPDTSVVDGKITLNTSNSAVLGFLVKGDTISFSATFYGKVINVSIPVEHILKIYAYENGQGQVFAATKPSPEKEQIVKKPALKLV